MKKILLCSLLFTQPVYAEYITNDIVSGCDGMYMYRAKFVLHTETCPSGYYLPANALSCELCSNGYVCNGGTYGYNPDIFQGAEYTTTITNNMNNICASNAPIALRAVFQPKSIICSAGYYLPANVDGCVLCTQNNKCVGGTYTFNETLTQGIEQCPNGTFSPTGSAVCYPHILHVGNDNIYLKSTKTTTPSLNIRVGNDMFYANMTSAPTRMNRDSEHYFKTVYNNEIYYICDDTICVQ